MFTARVRNAFSAALALVVAGAAVPALAHHSYAMFEKEKTRTLVGTVKAFQYTDPHGYLEMLVPTKSGKVQLWTIEMEAVRMMVRHHIKRDTFKPGEKVTVVISPLRNGSTGGTIVSAKLADGTVIGPIPRVGLPAPAPAR